jgi:hypothetical protein
MTPPDQDTDPELTALAAAVGLPIAPAHRPGVRQNLTLIAGMAKLVNDFPLDDADEIAPVFTP